MMGEDKRVIKRSEYVNSLNYIAYLLKRMSREHEELKLEFYGGKKND